MDKKTRTEYSMRNSMVAFVCKILVLIFAYASRIVFIRVLDVASTGAYGLFNNILIIFSLNSLGIDTALAFMLYIPLAEKDKLAEKGRNARQLAKNYDWLKLAHDFHNGVKNIMEKKS